MTDALVVFCSCPDETEAERIASGLLERRLAACVTILPQVKSVYRWRGAIETAREAFLIIKTNGHALPGLQDFIQSTHSYEVPEIVALPVIGGSEKYLAWILEECGT